MIKHSILQSSSTPIDPSHKLKLASEGNEIVDQETYQSAVGRKSLIFQHCFET